MRTEWVAGLQWKYYPGTWLKRLASRLPSFDRAVCSAERDERFTERRRQEISAAASRHLRGRHHGSSLTEV